MEYGHKADNLSRKNNICLFVSYFTENELPYYIRVYLKELKKHIQEVVLITVIKLDEESNRFLKENDIALQIETNEGFDFGLWYKAFQKIELGQYEQYFLVNDSVILFSTLDPFMKWVESNKADVKGMTYSEAVHPHIQSYFMVLNKRAAELALAYFKLHRIIMDIAEVIRIYELGMNRYFTDHGLKLASFVDNDNYKGEFSPYYKCVQYHLQKGIPLIKKKILMASYRKDELPNIARMGFDIQPDHYYAILKRQRDLIIDLDQFKDENPSQMRGVNIFFYNIKKALIKLFRPMYKSLNK